MHAINGMSGNYGMHSAEGTPLCDTGLFGTPPHRNTSPNVVQMESNSMVMRPDFFLTETKHRKPVVAVSACLLGQRVRYDGQDKRHAQLARWLADECTLKPLCPEVEAGLAVPRPPVQLQRRGDTLHAIGRDAPHLDVTDALNAFAAQHLAEGAHSCGYVLKSKSPSCGFGSTPLHDEHGTATGLGDGLFVAALRAHTPWLPITDEVTLSRQDAVQAFADACRLVWELRYCEEKLLAQLQDHYGVHCGPNRSAICAAILSHWQGNRGS